MQGEILSDGQLVGTYLNNTDRYNSDLCCANLTNTNLDDASFQGVLHEKKPIWSECFDPEPVAVKLFKSFGK